MTDSDRDPIVTVRYRDAAREEPPPALDDAIRAAARRAVESGPAPLVAPSGRRRRYVPLAAAAVIVLSAIVTLRLQEQYPDLDSAQRAPVPLAVTPQPLAESVSPPAAEPAAGAAPAPQDARRLRAHPGAAQRDSVTGVVAPKPAPPKLEAPRAPARTEPATAPKVAAQALREQAKPAEPQPFPGAVAKRQDELRDEARASAAEERGAASSADVAAESSGRGAVASPMLGRSASAPAAPPPPAETPEQWLERIARLRAAGRHEEADQSLAEFRRRHPDYEIRKEMLERVERPRAAQ